MRTSSRFLMVMLLWMGASAVFGQNRPSVITYNSPGDPITVRAMDRKPDGTLVLAGTHYDPRGELTGPCIIFADSSGLPSRIWRYSRMFGDPDMVRALPNGTLLVGLLAGTGTNVEDFLILIDARGNILYNVFPDSAAFFGAADTPYFGIDNSVTLSGGQALVSGYRWHLYSDERQMSFFYTAAGLRITGQYQLAASTPAGALSQIQPTQFLPYPGDRNEASFLAVRPDSSFVLVASTPAVRVDQFKAKSAYNLRPVRDHEYLPSLRSLRLGDRILYCITRDAGKAPCQILATDAASGRQLWHAQTALPGSGSLYAVGQNMLLLQNRSSNGLANATRDTIRATLFDPATGAILKVWTQFGRVLESGQPTPVPDSALGFPIPVLASLRASDGYRTRLIQIDSATNRCAPVPLPPQTPFTFLDTLSRPEISLRLVGLTGPDNGFRLDFNPVRMEDDGSRLCAQDGCSGRPLSPIGDTVLKTCGAPVRFILPASGATWQWSNGAMGNTVSLGPGRYQYTLTTSGCGTRTDSVIVLDKGLKEGVLGPDTTLCADATLTLFHPADTLTYAWFIDGTPLGEANPLNFSTQGLAPGPHRIELSLFNGECTGINTLGLTIADQTLRLSWLNGKDTLRRDTLFFFDQAQVELAPSRPLAPEAWILTRQPDEFRSGNPVWAFSGPDQVGASVQTRTAEGCSVMGEANLTLIRLRAPNILTLNQDNRNEAFRIENLPDDGRASLVVYNRWGKAVLRSKAYMAGWPQPGTLPGLYFYSITHPDLPGGRHTGWVEVVR